MSMKNVLFLFVLLYFGTPVRGVDTDITCTYLSSCVLPCLFEAAPDVVIHWQYSPGASTIIVHSFYRNSDQLGLQNPQYKGRTALFKDEIPKGNASLKLSGIVVSDRGRYKCYTSTIKGNNENFSNIKVQAPVSDVFLEIKGEKLLCRSQDIYPEPEVRWTDSPDYEKPETSLSNAESGLYSVVSSVRLPHSPPHEYSCNVSTLHSWRSATYRMGDPVTSSGFKAVVPCADRESSIKSLVWTFNLTETILNRTGRDTLYDKVWKSHVEEVSGSGELVLKDLTPDHQGLYSCVLTTDSGTFLTRTEVTVTEAAQSDAGHTVIIAVVVTVLLVLLLAGGGFLFYKKRKRRENKNRQQPTSTGRNKEEDQQLMNPINNEQNKSNGAQHKGDVVT